MTKTGWKRLGVFALTLLCPLMWVVWMMQGVVLLFKVLDKATWYVESGKWEEPPAGDCY